MKYTELQIETQRQAPARPRSEGEALLRRAGYMNSEGKLTGLGGRMSAHLTELAETRPPAEFFGILALPTILTEDGRFFFPRPGGREDLLSCSSGDYNARREMSSFRKAAASTERPAPLTKVATPDCNTIDALAAFLGMRREQTAKAMMYTRLEDSWLVFVVMRGDQQLSEAKLQREVGEVRPATPEEIVRAGAVPGYASPIGLKSAFIVVDDSIPGSPNLAAGANESGYHFLNSNYGRDYEAAQIADLSLARAGDPCPICGAALSRQPADLLADPARYHIDNLLEALAEVHHDERGLTWPPAASPFDVHLLHLPSKGIDTHQEADRLHESWQNDGLAVLFDDRDERAGIKFNDADLLGCPLRAAVGERGLKDGMVEFKSRTGAEIQLVPLADARDFILSLKKTVS